MQILLQDHILHTMHGDLEQVCVGGVRGMDVDVLFNSVSHTLHTISLVGWTYLARVTIQVPEGLLKERDTLLPARRVADVVGEVALDRGLGNLFLEQVDFVEEKDDGGTDEPLRVADTLEEHYSFGHLVLRGCQRDVL